jgi:diguanylate cyclase (GGDEF)-like protein/PAS domain S-box-containing protein
MSQKLQLRYTVAFGGLILFVVAVLGVLFYLQSNRVFSDIRQTSEVAMGEALHGEATKRLETLSEIMSEDLANPLYEYDMLTMLQLLQSVSRLEDVRYAMVIDSSGKVVHDGTELLSHYGQQLQDPVIQNWISSESTTLVKQNPEVLEVVTPIFIGERPLGWVRVGISRAVERQHTATMTERLTDLISEFQADSRVLVVVVTSLLLLIGLGLAHVISQRLVDPILQLSDVAHRVGQGDYGAKVVSLRDDELGQLIRAFNLMSQDLSRTAVSKQYLYDILNNMRDALTVISVAGDIQMVNAAACQMLNTKPDKLLNAFYLDLIDIRDRGKVQKWLKLVERKDAEPIDARYHIMPNQQVPVTLSASCLQRQGGERQIICVAQDISERQRNERHIRYLAQYDCLTSLPNRQLFMDRLKHAMDQAERGDYLIALLFIDLDRFKKINDSMGHQAGDRLLQETATRLKKLLRHGDTVARLGGDEFTVIVEQLKYVKEGTRIAELVIEEMKKPFYIESRKFYVGCSIGIIFYPFGFDNMESLLQKADMAMYQAKKHGRSKYEIYSHALGVSEDLNIRMENELIEAVKRKSFHLVYQPVMNIASGKLASMEALVRWDHPERGALQPAEFLPLLESSGLIIPLGDWILETACREFQSCQDYLAGTTRLNVNVSVDQFNQSDFPGRVDRILRETGFDPHLLELEITESCLVEDITQNREAVKTLKRLGIRIAVDDFGTGYSAFTYLREFELDTLKLDYSFVKSLPADKFADGICMALISMARLMELNVVAEGVERTEQLVWLRDARVQECQGYHCGHPLKMEKVLKQLEKRQSIINNSSVTV